MASVQKLLLGLGLGMGTAAMPVAAAEIKGLQLSSGPTGTRAELALDADAEYRVLTLKGPDRLVLDLPASSIGGGVQVPPGSGVVASVRTGQPVPGTARVVFDLVQPVAAIQPRIEHTASGPRLVVEWPDDGAGPAPAMPVPGATSVAVDAPADVEAARAAAALAGGGPAIDTAASAAATSRLISELAARTSPASAPAPVEPAAPAVPTTVATGVPTRVATGVPAPAADAAEAAAPPVKTLEEVMQGRGMRPLVIAIDPGHGGQDPGAVGLGGTKEKDVVLEISKELARQINATPGLRAYLTRDNDVFIPLNQRARLARKAKADLFISIHADAAENRKADGSSVYVLSLRGASSQRARWLADKENSSDLVGGVRLAQTNDTLASVLLDLTQSGHMRASEEAASEILGGLKRIGNIHKPNIERANFAVLRTSDMPSMLVETAFISNPEEERRLKDPAFQRKLAGAVLDGVNTFFTRQPPPGTMYAARAAASMPAGAAGGSP